MMSLAGFLGFVIVSYYLQVYCKAQPSCPSAQKNNPSPPSSLTLANYTTSSVILSWTPTMPTLCIDSYNIMSNTSSPSITDVMGTQVTLTVPASNNEPSSKYCAMVATKSITNKISANSEPICFILDVPALLILMYDITSDGNLTLTWTSDQGDRPPITAYYINLLDSSLQVLQVTLMAALSQHTIVLPDNFNVVTIGIIATNALGNNTGSQVNVSQPASSSSTTSNPLPTTSAMFSMSNPIVTTSTGMSSSMPPSTSNPIITTVASTGNPSLVTTSLSATSSNSNPPSVTTLLSFSTSNPLVTTVSSTGNPEVTTSMLSTGNSNIVMTSSISSTSNPPLVTTPAGSSMSSATSNPPLVTTSTGNPFTTSVSSMSSATSNPPLDTTLTSLSSSSNSLLVKTTMSSLGNPSITTLSLATTITTVSIASSSTSLLSFTSSLTKTSRSQYSSVVLPSSETTISEPSVSLSDSSSKGIQTSNTVSTATPAETKMATRLVSSSSSRVVISSSSSVISIATPSIIASAAPPASNIVSVIGGTVGGVLLLIPIGIVLIVIIVCITFRIKKNSKAYDVNTLEGEAIKINNAMYMEVGEHTVSNGGLVTKSELHPPIPTRHASLGTHDIANESTANVPTQQGETSKVELPTYQDPKSIRREVATSTGSIYTVHQKKTHSNQSSMVHVPASVEYADLSFTSRPAQPNVNQSWSEDDYDNISLVGSNAPNKINYTEVSFQGKDTTSRPIVNPQSNDDYDYILSTKSSNVPETHQATSKPQPNVNQSNDDYDDILSCLPSVPNGVKYNPQTGQYN